MGKSGESPALSRNCNPNFGEARIPALAVALKAFEERGEEQWSEDRAPLVTTDKGFFGKSPRPHAQQGRAFCLHRKLWQHCTKPWSTCTCPLLTLYCRSGQCFVLWGAGYSQNGDRDTKLFLDKCLASTE